MSLLLSIPLLLTGDPLSASRPAASQESQEPQDEVEEALLQAERVTPVVRVVQAVGPAVVNVKTSRVVQRVIRDFALRPRGTETREVDYVQGSGVVIDPAGYIVTNEHVVRGAEKLRVTFDRRVDATEYEAKLIGADAENDLALLKIDPKEPCRAVRLGRSDDLMIGETLVAIGNPLASHLHTESSTVSVGILSGIDRNVEIPEQGRVYEGLLQTDAAINSGNSGGPLLNLRGDLVGINTAIVPYAQGIGFAIPVDRVRDILHSNLFDVDRSSRFWLGMKFLDRDGLAIETVDVDGPAQRAGLQPGDQVVAVDGTPVESRLALSKAILPRNAGDRVRFRFRRGGAEQDAEVLLGSVADRYLRERLGVSVEPTRVGGIRGLRLVSVLPKSRAEQIPLKPDDVLLGVNLRRSTRDGWRAVQTAEELADVLQAFPSGRGLGIRLVRDGEGYEGVIVPR